MIWAFVDYENTGSIEGLSDSGYERILVFCGPKNNRIKFGVLPSSRFCCIELIGVHTMGPNNLDFHLAFHLGRFHEVAEKSTEFHIISNDSGFDGLVNHLKTIGRTCQRIQTRENPPPLLSKCAELVVARLTQLDNRMRPKTKDKLLNWIQSHCRSLPGAEAPDAIFTELVAAKLAWEKGLEIAYKISPASQIKN